MFIAKVSYKDQSRYLLVQSEADNMSMAAFENRWRRAIVSLESRYNPGSYLDISYVLSDFGHDYNFVIIPGFEVSNGN